MGIGSEARETGRTDGRKRETRMLDKTDDIAVAADNWLGQFEEALAKPDNGALKALFHPDSYWRDVLALSWNIQTLNGRDAILKALPRWPAAWCQAALPSPPIAPHRAR